MHYLRCSRTGTAASATYWTREDALAARGHSELLAVLADDGLGAFLPRGLDLRAAGRARRPGEPLDAMGDWARASGRMIAAYEHFARTGSTAWLDYLGGGVRPVDYPDLLAAHLSA